MKGLLLLAALTLSACATTTPTAASCAQAQAKVTEAQAVLQAAETAYQTISAQTGVNSQQAKDAQLAENIAQAALAAAATVVDNECAGATTTP